MENNVKQVIIIRKDLGMRKGKMIAQGSHASMKVLLDRRCDGDYDDTLYIRLNEPIKKWINGLFTKIVVYVKSESELLEYDVKAEFAGVPHVLIKDSGLTEFGGVPTYTAVAIGPDYNEKIDKITGSLPLL